MALEGCHKEKCGKKEQFKFGGVHGVFFNCITNKFVSDRSGYKITIQKYITALPKTITKISICQSSFINFIVKMTL